MSHLKNIVEMDKVLREKKKGHGAHLIAHLKFPEICPQLHTVRRHIREKTARKVCRNPVLCCDFHNFFSRPFNSSLCSDMLSSVCHGNTKDHQPTI